MSRHNCAIGMEVVPASYKGVGFFCLEANIEGGRRGAEGEFPFGEETAYADLGRKITVYNLTAVFREDGHVSDSQALFDACTSAGPGMLVHPTRGSVKAACRSIKLRDPLEEGIGESHAELEFVEAGDIPGGGGSLFGIIPAGLNSASQAVFLQYYQPLYVANPWQSEAIDTAQDLVGLLEEVMVRTMPAEASVAQWRDIWKMRALISDDGLAASAIRIDTAFVRGFVTIQRNITDPWAEFRVMKKFANQAARTMPASPAKSSQDAALSRFRILAGIGMAEAAMSRVYPTVNEPLVAMDQVVGVLSQEAAIAYESCQNELFQALRKYMVEFSGMMNDLTYRLPGVISVDFQGGVYPLVAAYGIYNDARRHRELETRNQVDANGRLDGLVLATSPVTLNR